MENLPPFQRSPLDLESYYVKEIACSVKDDFVDRQGKIAPDGPPQLLADVIGVEAQEDRRHWRFELIIASNDDVSKDFPYSLRMVLVGFFRVHEDYPEERVGLLATVNGPSLLYSAAREALVTVSSRTGYPALLLPTLLFMPPATEPTTTQRQALSPAAAERRRAEKAGGRKGIKKKSAKPGGKPAR